MEGGIPLEIFFKAPPPASQKEIGGIPLPKEYPHIMVGEDKFLVSHRGFGEKALSNYDKRKTGLQTVDNTITGLEMAVTAGSDTIEVDLAQTADGEYVLTHLTPPQKGIASTKAEYLKANPESLTLDEMLDWFSHQDERLRLYVELKSTIGVDQILTAVDRINPSLRESVLKRLMLYSSNRQDIERLIQEKIGKNLTTDQLKLWLCQNSILTESKIAELTQIGRDNCRIYGIEQGMVPWGMGKMKDLMKNVFSSIGKVAESARKNNLRFIVGTLNDPELINWLFRQGVDGVVPNNAVDFAAAGLVRSTGYHPIKPATDETGKKYLPQTLKARFPSN